VQVIVTQHVTIIGADARPIWGEHPQVM